MLLQKNIISEFENSISKKFQLASESISSHNKKMIDLVEKINEIEGKVFFAKTFSYLFLDEILTLKEQNELNSVSGKSSSTIGEKTVEYIQRTVTLSCEYMYL